MQEKGVYESDINDQAYEIEVLNSNRFNPGMFASSKFRSYTEAHIIALAQKVNKCLHSLR